MTKRFAVVDPEQAPGLFAIDPGLTTGVALWTPEGGLAVAELAGRPNFYGFFGNVVATGRRWHLIVEKYTVTARTAQLTPQPDALLLTGFCDGEAWKLGWEMDNRQLPVEAMRFANNAMLHAAGWYNPTKDGHQNDAARHLLLWFSKHRDHPFANGLLDEVARNLGI